MKVLNRLKKVEPGRILGGALGLLLILTLVFALAPPAMAIPQLAHRFDGSVTINVEPAAEGVEVSATIADVDEVFTATTDAEGKYHLLYVRGDDPETPEKEGGNNGDEIEFSVGGVYVISYTFESGGNTTLNLTIEAEDTTSPTVEITSTASPGPTNTSPIPMTATFSETVTGFVVGDITVGNGTAGTFVAVSGAVYTFDVTPTADGAVTVDIAAGVAQDAATNPNEAATQFSITYDGTAPTATVSPLDGATDVAVDAAVTAAFGEDVLEGALGDITITTDTTEVTGVSATLSEATDTITIAHDDFALDTSYTVTIPAGAVDDLAGNPSAEISWSFTTTTGVIPGDANGDGSVNALDITKVERIVAGLDAETPGADANQDGNINSLDITKTERIAAGLD